MTWVSNIAWRERQRTEGAAGGTEVTYELVLTTRDVGDVHVVGRGRKIFVLLASEDIGGDEMDLGVTVLASLGGRHVDNLARAALDHDETVLTQSRALHREGERRTGIGGLEGDIVLQKETRLATEATEDGQGKARGATSLALRRMEVVLRAPGEGHEARCGVMRGSGCDSAQD